MSINQKKPKIWRGILVGLVAGLAASWTMDRFQDVWLAVSPPDDSEKKKDEGRASADDEESQDDATVKAASAISEGLFEHKLTKAEKKIAGPVVHYAVGATSGIVYGIASELVPEVTVGFGFVFAPRVTRFISRIFAAVTVSDFLQHAYEAAKERSENKSK